MSILKNKYIALLLVTATAVALTGGAALTGKIATSQGEDVDSQELRSITVEGFEKDAWDVAAFPPAPESKVEVNLVDGKPKNLANDPDDKKSMGLRFSFVYSGFNSVTLTTPASKKITRSVGQLDEKQQPIVREIRGIELPGKVKAVSIWVLGRSNEYYLEGWLEDWKGDTHILNFGSLDYIGWRPLSAKVSDSIPQNVDSYPQTKTLVLKKFVIRGTPRTSSEEVVLFFDSIKVLTDMYDIFFDGADLNYDDKDKANKDKMKNYEDQLKKYSSSNAGGK